MWKKNTQTTVQQHQPSNGCAEKIVEDYKLCKSNNNEMRMLFLLGAVYDLQISSRTLRDTLWLKKNVSFALSSHFCLGKQLR